MTSWVGGGGYARPAVGCGPQGFLLPQFVVQGVGHLGPQARPQGSFDGSDGVPAARGDLVGKNERSLPLRTRLDEAVDQAKSMCLGPIDSP